MKENSIEEDIKILEEMIENANIENMDMNDCFGGEHIDAIEHVLSDYKRVLEMNEVLLKENEELNKKTKEQKECTFREGGTEECLWHCSNCHDEWLFYEGTPEENNLKYCPHCGAKVIKYESYIETEIEIANKMAKDYLKESEE